MSHQQGTIEKWQEDKGFGFIKTETGQSIFFHVSEFKAPRKPQLDESVVFETTTDSQGRLQATKVQEQAFFQRKQTEQLERQRFREARQSHQTNFKMLKNLKLGFVCSSYVLLALLAGFKLLSWFVVGWYVLIGGVTFALYYKDKQAAKNQKWRTPEQSLHVLAVCGGWLGALLAHTYLRHKSQKKEFRIIYYVTVFINIGILGTIIKFFA